jgi:hypothetical protein
VILNPGRENAHRTNLDITFEVYGHILEDPTFLEVGPIMINIG